METIPFIVFLLVVLVSYLAYIRFVSRYAILLRQSLKLCKSKRYFEAIAVLDRLLKIKPEDGMSWFHRGLLLSETEQYTEAIESYDLAIKYGWFLNFNFYSKVLYSKSLALHKLENYHDALVNYNLAFKTPGFGLLLVGRSFFYRTWYHQGLALHKLGNYSEAVDSYNLSLRQGLYFLWSGVDKFVFHFRSYEKIIAKHNLSLRQKPDIYSIWKSKSLALYELKKYEEAIRNLDQILKYQPDSDFCFYNKARCYAQQDQINLVLKKLQQALQINSSKYQAQIKVDSAFDNIRQNQQFKLLVE